MKPDCTGVEQHEDYMIFHAVRDTYSPIAVYKALVKMALSLLPYEKMPFFLDTVAWLKEESHLVSKYNMDNYAYMIERFIPGPRPLESIAMQFHIISFCWNLEIIAIRLWFLVKRKMDC